MASSFTWLDTSEADRRRALDVIDLFRTQATVDELGIGTVRDALADLLFPGTSTIQTRARYFLFVPWMYRRLEDLRVSSSDVARRARDEELRLVDVLADSTDSAGTIGIEARRALKRLPSAVYWGGLGTLGIRLFPGGQEAYHRAFDRLLSARNAGARRREDREAAPADAPTWDPHLPPPADGFPSSASMSLLPREAAYLQDRIRARAPGTLLAFLVDAKTPWPQADFPWEHPAEPDLPAPLREQLFHARCLSEVMQGAALLYNIMLAEKAGRPDTLEAHETNFAEWADQCAARAAAHRDWDRRRFWEIVLHQNPRVPWPTRLFINAWCDAALSARHPSDLRRKDDVQQFVANRERELKGPRARLFHREHLELWGGDSGTAALDYRWGTSQRIIDDILRGAAAGDSDARAA